VRDLEPSKNDSRNVCLRIRPRRWACMRHSLQAAMRKRARSTIRAAASAILSGSSTACGSRPARRQAPTRTRPQRACSRGWRQIPTALPRPGEECGKSTQLGRLTALVKQIREHFHATGTTSPRPGESFPRDADAIYAPRRWGDARKTGFMAPRGYRRRFRTEPRRSFPQRGSTLGVTQWIETPAPT